MILLLPALLAFQTPPAPAAAPVQPVPAAAAAAPADTTVRRKRRPPRQIALTPALKQSAFATPAARDLLLRARAARLAQDAALSSYDAKAYQRLSVGLAVTRLGRERLLLRSENSSRVRWSRGVGVWVELTGRRSAVPAVKEADSDVEMDDFSPVPYFPGRESLWFPSSDWAMARAEVDDREMVHPIAAGAEAYYKYAMGGSASLRLGPTRTIQLRELRVTARRPEWKLFTGSFWFDAGTGQLVRAAYRMSAELDIWKAATEEDSTERAERVAEYLARDSARRAESGDTASRRRRRRDDDDPPAWVKGLMSPMRASISAITVEYGLHDGRFWMPRAHYAEGMAQAGFARLPIKIQESFTYNSVNGGDPLPPLPPVARRDSARAGAAADSAGEEAHMRVLIGGSGAESADTGKTASSRRRSARDRQCATDSSYVRRQRRGNGDLTIGFRVPCDTARLARSPDLPPSIYDEDEALFGARERDELMDALGALQPEWGPQRPTVRWGLDLVRYNRVEALSVGALARQELGRGLALEGLARIGVGDWQPNGELTLARTNGQRTLRSTVYRRLAAANDWGAPLSLGASAGALLFGRDEGFYYRTYGAELTRVSEVGGPFSWRLFAERHGPARVETRFALARGVANAAFPPNIDAPRGTVAGVGGALRLARGVDPDRLRLTTELRAEAAAGSFDYVRGGAEVTLSRKLGGGLAAALTAGAGSSGGALPPQRLWYLGGSATVRGQRARPETGGDTYWLGRAELGLGRTAFRPSLFYDVGWTGDRDRFASPGRPLSGFGIGASAFDGIIRFDLAKGVAPDRSVRGYLYLDARF